MDLVNVQTLKSPLGDLGVDFRWMKQHEIPTESSVSKLSDMNVNWINIIIIGNLKLN